MALASEQRKSAPPSAPRLGDRRVWVAAGASGAIVALILLAWLAWPRDYYTGTNNTVARIVAGVAQDGQRYCLLGQTVPAGTGRIQLVGGSVTVDTQPGNGTRLAVAVPNRQAP